jgi:N-methylhydantoinase B/oxoprolinase/acetone carboxylase alpha subunit
VKRLDALLDEYGAETVRAALDALQDRAEALMRGGAERSAGRALGGRGFPRQ